MYQVGVRPSYKTGFAQWPGMSEYPQLWRGLVGAWAPFLGMTGNKVFDLSGNGNTGTFQGTSPSWTSGKFGSAVLLPGTDEAIVTTLNINESQAYAISCMYKATPSATVTVLMGTKISQNIGFLIALNGCWGSESSNNLLNFWFGGNTSRRVTWTDASIDDGNWHHLVVVHWPANGSIYFDGIFRATANLGSALNSISNIYIGSNSDAYVQAYYNGQIDHVMIYNRALSASEIALLYQIGMRRAG